MKTRETTRLILRPFTLDDVDASYQMNLDTEVSRYTLDGGVVSRTEIERRIREDVLGDYERNGFGRFAVTLKSGGAFIGFAGLKWLPELGQVDLGYRLMRQYWGLGYATEASQSSLTFGFEDLGLESIIAIAHPGNAASLRVMHKLGFQFEREFIEDGHAVVGYELQKAAWQAIESDD